MQDARADEQAVRFGSCSNCGRKRRNNETFLERIRKRMKNIISEENRFKFHFIFLAFVRSFVRCSLVHSRPASSSSLLPKKKKIKRYFVCFVCDFIYLNPVAIPILLASPYTVEDTRIRAK